MPRCVLAAVAGSDATVDDQETQLSLDSQSPSGEN